MIRLYTECPPHIEEVLAGVPAGTAARLDAFDQAGREGQVKFGFQTVLKILEYYGHDYDLTYEEAVAIERNLDDDLNRLNQFRLFGWGKLKPQAEALLGNRISLDGESDPISDPELISQVLAAQNVKVSDAVRSEITVLYCG